MARIGRPKCGDLIFHVLNRGNARRKLFFCDSDYDEFLKLLGEAQRRIAIRFLKFCLMPNHWHFLLWPYADGSLSQFMHWLGVTHTQRWHLRNKTIGTGHIYQGRFKSFPVQTSQYLQTVARYIERNPLRAKLVTRAEDWPWGSLHPRSNSSPDNGYPTLTPFPIALPEPWVEYVNQPEDEAELAKLRVASARQRPFGSDEWVIETAERLQISQSLRSVGRPRKTKAL